MSERTRALPAARIESHILLVRGFRVMLDFDLAKLYGVTTKRLNEQLKRNKRRFPPDFAFRLTAREKTEVVANCDHLKSLKFSAALPMAFTEHGSLMAASVLNSARAITASVYVVRAFVKLREMLVAHKELSRKLSELERRIQGHDEEITALFQAIRELMQPPDNPSSRIGFRT